MLFRTRPSRLHAALLLSSALVSSAMAAPGDGGVGGFSNSGERPGTASLTGAGGNASVPDNNVTGAGGGGAGDTGGVGASRKGDRDGGAGGTHGYSGDGAALESGTLSIEGTSGGDAPDTNSNYGAGGGGGGGFGTVATGSSSLNVTSGTIAGGAGGGGGDNLSHYSGGGGSGGYGLVLNNTSGTHTIGATVTGGDGGKGGDGNYGRYNDGGDGGDGILATGHASPVTVVIQGNVSGGDGGDRGTTITEDQISKGGNAGNGVKGANINVVLTGDASLAGGVGGALRSNPDIRDTGRAGSDGRAIAFTGGTNSLELQATSGGSVATLTGGIAHSGSTDVLKLGGGNDADFALSGLGGTFSGFGSYEKTGTATWTLTGNTTSTKAWTVSSGVLKLEGGSIAGITTISSGATLLFDQTADTTHAAAIEGAGGLKKTGGGALILTGSNTYSGGTVIEGGTLSGSSSAIRGNVSVSSGSMVDFNEAADVTNANAISGAGMLQKSGSGTLTLTGTNTYSGGTAVKAGTLSGSSSAIRGNVVVSSGAVVDFNEGSNVTNANVISGAGMLQKSGSGTLTLTGANTYSGGTAVKAGTLIADTATIFGGIDIGAGATMRFKQDADASYSGAISGAGNLEKFGAGALSLTGAYSLTGETKVSGGELLIGGAILTSTSSINLSGGNLTVSGNGARTIRELKVGTSGSLNLDGGSLTVSQAVTSTQHLSLTGTGTFNLDQTGNSLGGVTLRNGSLIVGTDSTRKAASLAADVSVLIDAILGGHGSITGDVTNNGRIKPGNSIGTLTISGDLSGSGILEIEVDGDKSGTPSADKLIVNGAVDISAMTLDLVLSPTDAAHWSYGPTGPFIIIENDGADGVTGPFAAVKDNLMFLDASLNYTAGTGNDVALTLSRNDIDMVSSARTVNQTATAAAIESLEKTNPVYLSVVATVADEHAARAAFDSLSGEINATLRSVLVSDSDLTRDMVLTRLRDTDSSGSGLWGSAIGNWGHYGSNEGTFDADSTTGGFLFGYDHPLSQALKLGVMAGYSRTDVSVDRLNSRAGTDSFHLGFYAGGIWNGLTYRGGVAAAYNDADVDRDVSATSTLSQSLTSDQQIYSTQGFAEMGYEFDVRGVSLEPFAGVAQVHLESGGFTEMGGSAALTASRQSDDTGFFWIGLRTAAAFDLFGANATAKAGVAWQHASEQNATFEQAFASGGDSFTVVGAPFSRDTAQVDAGLGVNLGKNTGLDLSYSGRLSSEAQNHGLNARLSIRF
ncbi:autotransporter domain-containing protein [Rhodobacterales bacterium]|nr:autotransporter domain-containing protein [Rhodobacterales bacterium]